MTVKERIDLMLSLPADFLEFQQGEEIYDKLMEEYSPIKIHREISEAYRHRYVIFFTNRDEVLVKGFDKSSHIPDWVDWIWDTKLKKFRRWVTYGVCFIDDDDEEAIPMKESE